jgi:hypothetical protein
MSSSGYSALTKTNIANIALRHLAGMSLTDLDTDTSTEAELINLYWPISLRETLRAADWRFASLEVDLTEDETEESDMWDYAYTYPDDCAMVREIIDTAGTLGQKIKYEVGLNDSQDGLLIWCNVEDAVARYTYVVDTVGIWPPEFVTCFALRLAYDIAYPLTQREDAKDTMFKLYQHAINHAIVASKAEGYRQFVFTSDALTSRRTS